MKNLLILTFLFMSINSHAQQMNKQIFDNIRNIKILINECDRETLTNFEEFKPTYDNFYKDYQIDSLTISKLKNIPINYNITIVLGTWCGDSKYWVPNFLRVLDEYGFPEKNLKIITVDGNKKTENNLIDNLNISKVPTFIIYNSDKSEIGRITESPKESLEIDLLSIINSK